MSLIEELNKYALPLICLLIGSFLTYWFGIRGKKKDIDDKRVMELNVVLSDMLIVWHYLNKVSEIIELWNEKTDGFLFPTKYFPLIVLKSGVLNDKCFKDLEESIHGLKRYDPISYYQLEGVGNRLNYFRGNYIIPLLQTQGEHEKIARIVGT